jgi:hypothetical protein
MPRKLFAGLLTATLTVGAALPALAADEAFQVAQSRNQAQSAETGDADVREIRALLSGVSSLILPGFGQWVFNQERPKAVMHFLGAVALWSIPALVPIPSPLDRLYVAIPTLFHLYSGYDAYQGAGGEMKLVSQPALTAWSFDSQVARFGQEQALGHLSLASTQLSD